MWIEHTMNENENAIVVAQPQAAQVIRLGDVQLGGPTQLIPFATQVATELVKIVDKQKLFKQIGPKKYPLVEAWTTCAAMLGVTPRESGVVERDGEFEATVELVNGRGDVIGKASAICGMDEPTWASRPRYARRSMAITRATGKACRLKYSWIMTLAGYEPTPAEEMDGVIDVQPVAATKPSPAPSPKPPVSAPVETAPVDDVPWHDENGDEVKPVAGKNMDPEMAKAFIWAETQTEEELKAHVCHFPQKYKDQTMDQIGKGGRWFLAEKWEVKPWKDKLQERDCKQKAAAVRLRELLGEDKQ